MEIVGERTVTISVKEYAELQRMKGRADALIAYLKADGCDLQEIISALLMEVEKGEIL